MIRCHLTDRARYFLYGTVFWATLPIFFPAAEASPGAPEEARAWLFQVDAGRTSIRFELDAVGHTVRGRVMEVTGHLRFDPENLSRESSATFQVPAASLATGNRLRDRKMRKSHLEVREYPSIAFHSSTIEAIAPTLRSGEVQELRVKGVLELHGAAQSLEFLVKAVRTNGEVRVTGEIPLRLSDFGIRIPRFLFFKVKDEMKVLIDIVAVHEPSLPEAS